MHQQSNPTLVVLAGGMGSRYGGLKQLDGVGPDNETIIEYSVFDAIRAGFKKAVFVVRESIADEFQNTVSSRFEGMIDIELAYQPVEPDIPGIGVVSRSKPWGTAHAVLCAKEVVDSPFAVINADDYYGASSFKLMQEFLVNTVTADRYAMVGFELSKTLSSHGSVARAICQVDNTRALQTIVERTKIIKDGDKIIDQSADPMVQLSPNDPVSMNFWGFHPAFFTALEESFYRFAADNKGNPKAEFYIPIVIDELLKQDDAVVEVLQSQEQWHGLTYAEDMTGIKHAMSQMTGDGLYPSPLWGIFCGKR